MFKVRDDKWNIYTVYAAKEYKTRTDAKGTMFLVFLNRQNVWAWLNAEFFVPYSESDITE